jgi:hypothetical protein
MSAHAAEARLRRVAMIVAGAGIQVANELVDEIGMALPSADTAAPVAVSLVISARPSGGSEASPSCLRRSSHANGRPLALRGVALVMRTSPAGSEAAMRESEIGSRFSSMGPSAVVIRQVSLTMNRRRRK